MLDSIMPKTERAKGWPIMTHGQNKEGAMRRAMIGGAMLFALLEWGTVAWADPIVSIDVDPLTAGIQSALTVNQGDTFTVDVVISNLDPSGPTIQRVEFDLDYDSSMLSAIIVSLGGFFTGGTVTIVENDILSPDVNFTALGDGVGNDSTQPFASVTFTAIDSGHTVLDLNDVALSDKDGLFVFSQDPSSPVDGALTVSAIPEPSSLVLLGSGLIGFGLYRWWRTDP
ncbi:MAG: PEP-CTERM sorting domain-containing protein [Nitrospirae bacterium]|nr:MAG: PEP-CTERM sorting domain-containing protein [Nitrospirota bacterium]